MGFIDSHAHIDGEEFDLDRDEMIARAREAGAEAILVPAINMEGLDKLRSVVKTYPGFAYAMIGLHPEDVRPNWREVVDEMRRIQMEAPKEFIAIGEVGLDFYWSREYEHEQTKCFEEHVRWAIEAQLPLMIHCRKAQNEMVAILKKYRGQLCGGVFHCFAGNEKEAAELLAFDGFLIGVGGVLTFKKSHLPEVLHSIPLDRMRNRRTIHGSRANARQAQRECVYTIHHRAHGRGLRHHCRRGGTAHLCKCKKTV